MGRRHCPALHVPRRLAGSGGPHPATAGLKAGTTTLDSAGREISPGAQKRATFSTSEPRAPSREPRLFGYYFVVMGRVVALGLVVWVCVAATSAVGAVDQSAAAPQAERAAATPQRAVLDRYCVTCHNARLKTANLALDTLDLSAVGGHAAEWEKVVRKLRGGLMPPAGRPRPDQATQDGLITWLETELDAAAAAHPNPGASVPIPLAPPTSLSGSAATARQR